MDNRKTIEEELAALESTLQQMPVTLPFRVPEAYFDEFPEIMLMAVRPLEWRIKDLEKQRVNPFSVPPAYFERFSVEMLLKIKDFEKSARQEIEELSPLLAKISRQMPYSLQNNYFQTATAPIPQHIHAEEEGISENEPSGLLAPLRTRATYTVPDNYFEELPAMLAAKMRPRQGRLVSMSRFGNFRRMAVAAAVAGLVLLAGWFFNKPSTNETSDIVQMEDISLEELETFTESRTALAVDYAGNSWEEGSLEEEDFREFFDDFSDQEIQSYLIHYSGLSAGIQ